MTSNCKKFTKIDFLNKRNIVNETFSTCTPIFDNEFYDFWSKEYYY